MTTEDISYHRQRERQCRELAGLASDPDVRRRHEQLAALHASRAAAVEPPLAAQAPAQAQAHAQAQAG